MSRFISGNNAENFAQNRQEEEQQQKNPQKQPIKLQQHRYQMANSQILIAIFLVLFATNFDATNASQDLLPNLCDAVKCPPISEMVCPDDSDLIENLQPMAAALLNPMGADLTSTQAPLPQPLPSPQSTFMNASSAELSDELYAQCCLTQKCRCRTCYIPDCKNEYEIIVELVPESPLMPGQCCGQYECQTKPNCSEVRDTEHYWLADCQRCKCHSGERICHQSCDEGMRKPTAICKSKTLNQYFEHGQTWKSGCYECECVNGEEKCIMPFCRSVNCPAHRQVLIKDSCCPVCWPKGIPMPNGDEDYEESDDDVGDESDDERGGGAASGGGVNGIIDEHNYEDEDIVDEEQQSTAPQKPQPTDNYALTANEADTLLPDINFDKDDAKVSANAMTKPTASPSEASNTTKAIAIAMEVLLMENSSSAPAVDSSTKPPCTAVLTAESHEMPNTPATYKVYPEVVEVVRQNDQSYLLYMIIGILGLVIFVLVAWNVHLRHKQRSYRPVSNFDDNFNNKTSSNIKKMNDYV